MIYKPETLTFGRWALTKLDAAGQLWNIERDGAPINISGGLEHFAFHFSIDTGFVIELGLGPSYENWLNWRRKYDPESVPAEYTQ